MAAIDTTTTPAHRCTTCDATGRVLACGCRQRDCDTCERGDLDICPDCIDGWRYWDPRLTAAQHAATQAR